MKHLVFSALLLGVSAGAAFACADGPDSYRVTGVASDDVLNVRSGPHVGFTVIGKLPHDAQGVQNLDAVPVHTCDGNVMLTIFETENRWTKISWTNDDTTVFGWVKSSYLSE